MDPKQNPFSLYDFLGYFVPGSVVVYLLILGPYLSAEGRPFLTAIVSNTTALSLNNLLPFVLASYIAGHLVSFLSSITVEKYSNWAYGFPPHYLFELPRLDYFRVLPPKIPRLLLRISVWAVLLPITAPDFLLGRVCRMASLYAKPLDKMLQEILRRKIDLLIRNTACLEDPESFYPEIESYDFFRFVYHWALEYAPAHTPKLQNYVALYGFLRTMTFIGVAVFWRYGELAWRGQLARPVQTLTILLAVTFTLFMAFMKFYRRFSLEGLMAAAVMSPFSQSPDAQHSQGVA